MKARRAPLSPSHPAIPLSLLHQTRCPLPRSKTSSNKAKIQNGARRHNRNDQGRSSGQLQLLVEKALCDLVLGCSVFVEMQETPLIDFPGIEARRGFPQYPLLLSLGESGL